MPDQHTTGGNSNPKYWSGLGSENLPVGTTSERPEFDEIVKAEFNPRHDLSGLSRRKFLALLGASAAFTAAGCSDYPDRGEIVPYTKKPEDITLGKANYYASTCTACSLSCGTLIKTREGRPIKIDGNPEHPVNKGKLCALGQAHILNLYDPSRITDPYIRSGKSINKKTWEELDQKIIDALNSVGNKEISILVGKVVSPAYRKVLEQFKQAFPTVQIYEYQPFSEYTRAKAWQNVYGTAPAAIDFSAAKIILSLEGDILGVEGSRVEQVIAFSGNRDTGNPSTFTRLYCAEANLSVTGMNADHRFRIKPEHQLLFVLSLANEIGNVRNASAIALDNTLNTYLSSFTLQEFCSQSGVNISTINRLVDDLLKNKGKSIVYAGRDLTTDTHAAALLLNEMIGGTALCKVAVNSSVVGIEELSVLTAKMKAGDVGALIICDQNPVYTLPRDLDIKGALKTVGLLVTMSEFENETTAVSHLVLPLSHTLESWGDASPEPGIFSTQQPVIAPLYNTRQQEAMFLVWASKNATSYSTEQYLLFLKEHWRKDIYPTFKNTTPFEQFWLSMLHDGVVVSEKVQFTKPALKQNVISTLAKPSGGQGWSMIVKESFRLGSGKYAQNGWLQELPHPVSKITWDNYAAISKKSADELGISTEDQIEIRANGITRTVPVLVQPGMADKFVCIETGYGRTAAPVVAIQSGFNANVFIKHTDSGSPYFIRGIEVKKGSGTFKLASTQDHYLFNDSLTNDLHHKREIIREGTLDEFQKDRNFLRLERKEESPSMYPHTPYTGVKWAMAIDMNKCIGCGDCSVACSVENNIPIVGKDQVLMSREMQWMRIDRYYSGEADDPDVSVQPMLCQHCDQAPCENVCPVVATNHSPDGLNQMVYNRCVGTRYCSNNCPYKVRRFNFYNFRDHFEDGHYLSPVMQLAANPEVTTRSRGVMEKCTFCVHRISDARSDAARDGKEFDGADVTTACQDACPASAITFGNVNDPKSNISKMREHPLGYTVLEELNIHPNVTYLAKLRNTHSEDKK